MTKTNSNNPQNPFMGSYDQYATEWTKQLEQSVSACREASEALLNTGSMFAKGFEEVFTACVSRAQNANEKNSQLWQSFLACRNMNDLAEAQNKLTQGTFEEALEATSEMSELSAKMWMDAWEPLNKQVSEVMKKAAA